MASDRDFSWLAVRGRRAPRGRAGLYAALVWLGLASAALPAHAQPADPVIYSYDGAVLFDGAYGPVAAMQKAAKAALQSCNSPATIVADGRLGKQTKLALAALANCVGYDDLGAVAKTGVMTQAYWRRLMATDPPSIDERARTLMLTFEATDYTAAEWNFCQSRPLYDPTAARPVCYSNDPHSYLTWGPNGATAGGGREIQAIVQRLDTDNPDRIDAAFGPQAADVRRMSRLRNDSTRSLETYLCAIWSDPVRRAAWRVGFAELGRDPAVRIAFDSLYRSVSYDGGKITTFEAAYAAFNLKPTEVDYAFFKDRAAHTSPNGAAIRAAIRAQVAANADTAGWRIRRAISLNVRPSNQRKDRLGRDVAFYVDGLGTAALSTEERAAWTARGMCRASSVGLTDDRPGPDFTAGPTFSPVAPTEILTDAEKQACPAAVLNTQKPT